MQPQDTTNNTPTTTEAVTATLLETVKADFPAPYWASLWLVGGTVRDMLLGQRPQDIDLIASLTPEQLASCGFRPVIPVSGPSIWFKHLPTATRLEVTVIASPTDLATELKRRDFTINALAMGLDGNLIDLFDGTRDLQAKELQPCSLHVFQQDPLRIFRALRFSAAGWQITPELGELIRQRCWETDFGTIPIERFSREMVKALAQTMPQRFFLGMIELQVGRSVLPELFRMRTIPAGPLDKHPEGDLFTHTMQVVARVAEQTDDPLARFCALFHDIGKLATAPAHYPRHHGHDQAGQALAGLFCTRLRLPRSWQRALAATSRLHTTANNWQDLRDATRIRMAETARKAGISKILPLIAAADKPGQGAMSGWDTVVSIAGMQTAELGIAAERLLALAPVDRSGLILQHRIRRVRQALGSLVPDCSTTV